MLIKKLNGTKEELYYTLKEKELQAEFNETVDELKKTIEEQKILYKLTETLKNKIHELETENKYIRNSAKENKGVSKIQIDITIFLYISG